MKLFKKITALTLGFMLIAGLSTGYAQITKPASSTKEAKIKTEFDCAGAKSSIETALLKEPGIKTAVADLKTKIVTVTYDGNTTSQARIVATLEKTGYRTEFTPADKKVEHKCIHDQTPGSSPELPK